MAGAMRLSGRCYPEASAKAPWSLSHLTSFPAGPERTTPRSAPCSAPAPGRSRSLSSRLVSRQQGVQLPCVPATFVLSGCPIPSSRQSSSPDRNSKARLFSCRCLCSVSLANPWRFTEKSPSKKINKKNVNAVVSGCSNNSATPTHRVTVTGRQGEIFPEAPVPVAVSTFNSRIDRCRSGGDHILVVWSVVWWPDTT